MTKPFELAPDANTRAIDCGQFSRTASGAPFCACLNHPYCCGVGGSPNKCSFWTPKEQGPYKPKKEAHKTGRPKGSTARHIDGLITFEEAAQAIGIKTKTVIYRAKTIWPVIESHTKKIAGTYYMDEYAFNRIAQSHKAHGRKAKK